MKNKNKCMHQKHGICRRVFSLFLVFAMLITMTQLTPTGMIPVKAAEGETNIRVHFYNEFGWGAPALQYWQPENAVPSEYEAGPTEIEGWGGACGYTLKAEGDNWYSMSLKGNIEGFQFLDMGNPTGNTAGKGYDSNMAQYQGETPVDLYCKYNEATGYDCKWYTDKECTMELKAPEGAETPVEECGVLVHFYNKDNWSEVTAYYWGSKDTDTSWPGAVLQKNADHEGWYDLTVTGKKGVELGIVFNNNGNGQQTVDVKVDLTDKTNCEAWYVTNRAEGGKLAGDLVYSAPESWTNPGGGDTPTEPGGGDTPTEPGGGTGDITVTELKVSDRVQLKTGDALTDMQIYRNGVYETAVNLTAGTHEIKVLVNGIECEGTVSVTVDADKDVYFRLNKEGKLQNSVNDKIVHTAALTGNFAGIEFVNDAGERYDIASWNPADANGELTYVGGGIYTRTFLMNELASDVEIADGGYKVSFDDSWDYALGNGDQNLAVTLPAGTTAWTVFVDEVNGMVYDSVRTETFETIHNSGNRKRTPFQTTVSLVGDARGTGTADWDAAAKGYEFTAISDTLYRYQKTFAPGTYNYKCVFEYADWYEAEDGNRSITITEPETAVVFLYNTVDGKLYDSVQNGEETAVLMGMKAAPAKMEVADNANGSTTFTALADAGKNVTLHYGVKTEVETNGISALKTADMTEDKSGVYHSEALYFGDGALDFVYYYDVDGTRVLDGSNPSVNVGGADYSNYTRAKFEGRDVYVPGTFPGKSWDAASNRMTYKGNGLYEYCFKEAPAANYEFKIAMGSWSENYGKDGKLDGANMSAAVPKTQDVYVWYNDFSHRAVTSLDYVFADVSLSGTGIPEGTKLTDDDLTGIYSATVFMMQGTYADVKIGYDGKEYTFAEFAVDTDKNVTFYFDPVTEIYYNNASDVKVETANIFFDSKDTEYKSVFGAVATGEKVKFAIQTGSDAKQVSLVVKGMDTKTVAMQKDGAVVDGVQKWSAETSFDTIGEYGFYFVISNGSSVCVYADDDGFYGEGIVTELTNVKPYALVVYKAGYQTPDWMKNAVIYQIFPDRFYNGDTSNDFAQTAARGPVDYEYITDWYTLPENPEMEEKIETGEITKEAYLATGAHFGDGEWSNEIYGGDLKGIVERIDYLKALGVNVIYLNPVFASISNHRYDTSDYKMIDPILGDMGSFAELVKVAEENDMHIILDGVFNHVSDDSIYFDRYYQYLEEGTDAIGAYPYWAYVYDYMNENGAGQEAAEKEAKSYFTENYGITNYDYVGWFKVENKPMGDGTVTDEIGLRAGKPVYQYEGWWGYDSMPVIMSTNGSEFQTGTWAEEIIGNKNHDSVTEFWLSEGSNGWRLDVANEVSDETWQNFRESVKALDSDAVVIGEIWDDATKYLKGDMYDSVMNYVFRGAALDFVKGGSAYDSMNTLEKIRERYPKEAFYAMMNLVDSHDTTRVLSYINGIDDDRKQKDLASAFPTYENTSELAKQRQYLAAFLQFTYAGAPTIYYGDEAGMTGADDPDDRRGFIWGKGNKELVLWYAKLAAIRAEYPALRTGDVEVLDAGENVMAYIRADKQNQMLVLANNAQEDKEITLNLSETGLTATELTDLIGGASCTVENGQLTVTVPKLSGMILTAQEKQRAAGIRVNEAALEVAYNPEYVVAESVLAEKVTVNQTSITLKAGENTALTATVAPVNATDKTVWFTSDNEVVATVSSDGRITAVAEGTAVITARAVFTADETVYASCTVKVEKAAGGNQTGGGAGGNQTENGGTGNQTDTGTGNTQVKPDAGNHNGANTQYINGKTVESKAADAPKTSDDMAVRMYFAMLLLVAGAGLAVTAKKRGLFH